MNPRDNGRLAEVVLLALLLLSTALAVAAVVSGVWG